MFCLGVCYGNGTGVSKDESEAVKWYRKAAECGYKDAEFRLMAAKLLRQLDGRLRQLDGRLAHHSVVPTPKSLFGIEFGTPVEKIEGAQKSLFGGSLFDSDSSEYYVYDIRSPRKFRLFEKWMHLYVSRKTHRVFGIEWESQVIPGGETEDEIEKIRQVMMKKFGEVEKEEGEYAVNEKVTQMDFGDLRISFTTTLLFGKIKLSAINLKYAAEAEKEAKQALSDQGDGFDAL